MQKEIETLIQTVANNYFTYTDLYPKITRTEGKKYIRISVNNSAWGFVVKEDGGKFRKGDILKAAGYSTPAKNFSRGNILDGGYAASWTGA